MFSPIRTPNQVCIRLLRSIASLLTQRVFAKRGSTCFYGFFAFDADVDNVNH